MKKWLFILLIVLVVKTAGAQASNSDSTEAPKVTVTKDPRIDMLAKHQVDVSNSNIKMAARFTKGYRLFVLKTDDRDYAMKVRAYLLQTFPDEKVIMSFQAPFIKMKFGDFVEKADAEKVKKQIVRGGVITGGIYIVPDTIEVKPDKDGKDDSK